MTGVTVRVWPAGGPLYRTRIETLSGGVAGSYGQDREFDNLTAALIHCAQMLRVLADDKDFLGNPLGVQP